RLAFIVLRSGSWRVRVFSASAAELAGDLLVGVLHGLSGIVKELTEGVQRLHEPRRVGVPLFPAIGERRRGVSLESILQVGEAVLHRLEVRLRSRGLLLHR